MLKNRSMRILLSVLLIAAVIAGGTNALRYVLGDSSVAYAAGESSAVQAESSRRYYPGGYTRGESSRDQIVQTDTVQQPHFSDYEEELRNGALTPIALKLQQFTFAEPQAYFGELMVSNGDIVEAGQVLFTYTLETSGAELEEVRRSLLRTQESFEKGVATRQETIEETKERQSLASNIYDYQILTLQLEKLELELERYTRTQEEQIAELTETLTELEADASLKTYTAGASGIVDFDSRLTRYKTGDPMEKETFSFSDPSSYRFCFHSAAGFRYGMEVEVTYGPNNRKQTARGRIVAADDILETEDAVLRSCLAYNNDNIFVIELEGVDPASIVGESVNLSNQVTAVKRFLKDVLLIGRRALSMDGGKYFVQVVEDGSLRKQFVAIGCTGTNYCWVVGGLSGDETVYVR